jgi:hypothetical protein
MHESRADLSQAFCSYCGYPPMGRWRSLAHRVCMRCEMGTVLRAPPGLQPRFYEPFVVVDARLRVQAVSHHTEAVLKVEEPAVIDAPLTELLMCRTDQDQIDLAGAVGRALAGATLPTRVALRAARDPAIELVARVAACGPPPAGLLILTPLRTPRTRRSPGPQRWATVGDRGHGRSSDGVGN